MPRSKNPNPRQVTESEENKPAGETGSDLKEAMGDFIIQTTEEDDELTNMKTEYGDNSPLSEGRDSPLSMNIIAKRDSLAKLTARKFAAIYNASDDSENEHSRESPFSHLSATDLNAVEHEMDIDSDVTNKNHRETGTPEPRTSLNFSPSSPPSFFVMGAKSRAISSQSSRPPPPLRRMVGGDKMNGDTPTSLKTKTQKSKGNSPSGMLNPGIMRWMQSRFEMKPGGRISASDIIRIYNKDMEDLPNPPPTLQNYQVGQLLRRIFPTIQRCKITVNSKRVWVYRHLSLIDPPNEYLDDGGSRPSENKDNCTYGEDIGVGERVYDSPMDDPELEDGDSRPDSLGDEIEKQEMKVGKKEKSNAILLGLLGQRNNFRMEPISPNNLNAADEMREENSPNIIEKNGVNGVDIQPTKKKRDSEVVDWLMDNYKIKAGYFVKSMDLLRRYNDGREELVKYLSQVGRVMKHVFPGVRHLRKSFRGGKREWVYLNLKPIDVDSDGEEGKNMQMHSMRRTVRPANVQNSLMIQNCEDKTPEESLDWKRERVNITHMPFAQTQNAIFKPRANMYHSVSRIDGNKLIISRNSLCGSPELATQQSHGNVPHLQENGEKSLSRTRIILYNKQRDLDRSQMSEDCHVPCDLEQDIFAPFTKQNQKQGHNINAQTKLLPKQSQFMHIEKTVGSNSSENTVEWLTSSTSGVFLSKDHTRSKSSSPDENHSGSPEESDCHWASKRLRLCATETSMNGIEDCEDNHPEQPQSGSSVSVGLDLSIKQENETSVKKSESKDELLAQNEEPTSMEVLNLTKCVKEIGSSLPEIVDFTAQNKISPSRSQTIHYKPNDGERQSKGTTPMSLSIISKKSLEQAGKEIPKSHIMTIKQENQTSAIPLQLKYLDAKNLEILKKRKYCAIARKPQEATISWESLQTFNAQRYGWLRSPHTSWTTSKIGDNGGKKVLRFVEWFLFSGQWLVDKQRALREVKIYDDWTVVIHALGRRVYPNDLGGITDLEKTSESLNKVFRVLAEAKLCMGFPAPCVSDLHIHGILVSKFEVWSSREDNGEDIRQRAVNCQILYSSPGSCCTKCARIMRLHQQQKRGASFIKRSNHTEFGQARTLSK